VVSLAAACASKGGGPPVGVSDRVTEPPRSIDAGVDAGPPLTGPLASWRSTMTKLTTSPVVSVGHAGGRFEIEVFANELGKRALDEHAPAQEGAAFAVVHTERATTPRPGPLMLMQKEAKGYATARGDWRYVVVTASGSVALDGPEASCADCHDEAPVDRIFPFGVVKQQTAP
jgi:hypothetical protein